MPGNKTRNKRSRRGKGIETPAGTMVYTGPSFLPKSLLAADCHTVELSRTAFLTSTAGGVLAANWENRPDNAFAWSTFNSVFSEFRVLSTRVEYFPNNRYSKTTTICRPMLTVVEKGGSFSTALASYNAAVDYSDSCRKHSLEDPWSREAKMSGSEEAAFLAIASPASTSAIKYYADGLSVTTEYGMYVQYYLVQFRGRQ
jgi:hypothetical protein